MKQTRTLLPVSLLVAALCMPLSLADAAPKSKARPSYYVVLQAPVLEKGLHANLALALTRKLQTRLGKSASMTLGQHLGSKRAVKRHLRKKRLAGLTVVPRVTCKAPKKVNGNTVVRCQTSVMLLSLSRQNLISAYWCEAEVQSALPAMTAADLQRMQQDVLVAAADGAVDDLIAFLETNRPGKGRLPRRGQ